MTFTEISEVAGKRLIELTSIPIEEAVIKSLPHLEKKRALNIEDIYSLFDRTDTMKYFVRETGKTAKNVEIAARKYLESGYKASGSIIPINSTIDWGKYKQSSRNIRFQLHSWSMIDMLLRADEISESTDYIIKAIELIEDWTNLFIIERREDEFAWHDMAVGKRATQIVYVLNRMIELKWNFESICKLIISAEIHRIELSQVERIATHSNHGLFQVTGLLALTKSLPWLKDADLGSKIALDVLQNMVREHFTLDGLHKEHSPEYHLLMVNHFSSLIDSGWLTNNTNILELVRLISENAHWMKSPSGDVIAVGDTKNNTKMKYLWHGCTDKVQNGLKAFPTGGLAINNSVKFGTQTVFTCQFHSRQHKHADENSVIYFANGKQILVDSGTFTYKYDLPERMYCESTRSHNTIEIDSKNYSRFRNDAFGSGLTYSTEVGPCAVFSGFVHHQRLVPTQIPNNKIQTKDGISVDIKHKRTIIDYPSRFLAIIDELDSSEIHEFVQWNHINPELEVDIVSENKVELIDEFGNKIAKVWNKTVNDFPMQQSLIKGQTEPNLQGWQSSNGVELESNYAIGFSESGKQACFATVIDTAMEKKTGQPYLNRGSNGKYLRFAFVQNSRKADFRFRFDSNSNLIIEATIDKIEYNIEIKRDE